MVWIHTVDIVADGLAKADPSNKDFYLNNAASYKKELEALDQWANEQINSIPSEKRVLITAHDAFQYFAKRYNLEVKALQGLSSADEAGINAVQELTDFIKSRGIPTIFAESTTNDKGIASVAKNAGATINTTHLYADACGPLGEIKEVNGDSYDVGTYTGMIKHNVNTIVNALK